MSNAPQGPGWWQASDSRWYPPSTPPYGYPPAVAATTNGLAIASLVLGIVWLGGLGALLAIIFGAVAISQINRSGGTQSGRGLATAGIVLGGVGVILPLFLIVGLTFVGRRVTTNVARPASLPTFGSVPREGAVTLKPVSPGATITGDTPCPKADGSSPRTSRFAKAPPTCIDPTRSYTAELATSKGTITISLDAKTTPLTVNNFVVLARYHFYDGIAFHRIVSDFVDQVGDPTETGSGGPGYTFPDELPRDGYKAGSVAMANAGPNTNGSQIFIVVSERGASQLTNRYSLFGQVTVGMDVVQAINAVGLPSEQPSEVVTINSVVIREA